MAVTQTNDNDISAHVSWALAYPFDVPDRSFLYVDGDIFDFADQTVESWAQSRVSVAGRAVEISEILKDTHIREDQFESERVPVIACGSNASPQRLKQKFDQDLPGSLVPTLKATLTNYTAVFAAKFTEYGSVPATLAYTPGTESDIYVNFLTLEQLSIMDGTETLGCSYDRPVLDHALVQLEDGSALQDVHAYISRHGCFAPQGDPIALTGVKSGDNPFVKMEQFAVQHAAKALLKSPSTLDDFIFENISNEKVRSERSQYLAAQYSIPAGRTAAS